MRTHAPNGTSRKPEPLPPELALVARKAAAFARDPLAGLRVLEDLHRSPGALLTLSPDFTERMTERQAVAFERALRRVGLAAPASPAPQEPPTTQAPTTAPPAPTLPPAVALSTARPWCGPGLTAFEAAPRIGYPTAIALRSRLSYLVKRNKTDDPLWPLRPHGEGRDEDGKYRMEYVGPLEASRKASEKAARDSVDLVAERARSLARDVARRLPELTAGILARGKKRL